MALVITSFILVGIISLLVFFGYIVSPSNPLFIWLGIVMNILGFIISSIYFIAARRVYRHTKERKDPKTQNAFFRMMIKICLSGAVMMAINWISYGYLFITIGSPTFFYLKFIFSLLYSVRMFLMIDLFGAPPREQTKSTKQDNSHSSQPSGSTATAEV